MRCLRRYKHVLCRWSASGHHEVVRDNRQAASIAARYLIERGHRYIAYIGGQFRGCLAAGEKRLQNLLLPAATIRRLPVSLPASCWMPLAVPLTGCIAASAAFIRLDARWEKMSFSLSRWRWWVLSQCVNLTSLMSLPPRRDRTSGSSLSAKSKNLADPAHYPFRTAGGSRVSLNGEGAHPAVSHCCTDSAR